MIAAPPRVIGLGWGRIEVEVLSPLPPRMGSGDAATELRDAARERIAARAGEPLL